MSKREEIIKLFNERLFSNQLKDSDFLNGWHSLEGEKAVLFKCKHKGACDVDPKEHPIWTPALGDEDTTVMVVGEAPSAGAGRGVHIGGLFKKWDESPKSPVISLRDWPEFYSWDFLSASKTGDASFGRHKSVM